MLNLGSLTFATPWLLGFLAVLPVLWWLLRLTPPAPKKILFPALALLTGLIGREETPARSPWWLLLLRLLIAALLIFAFARPVLDPIAVTGSHGTLLIAVDNDWASARDWDQRQNILRDLLQKAKREQQSVMILPTTPPNTGEPVTASAPLAAEAAFANIEQLKPEPWPADWVQATAAVRTLSASVDGDGVMAGTALAARAVNAPSPSGASPSEIIWLASGLGSIDAKVFYDALQKIAPTKVIGTSTPIYDLLPPSSEGDTQSIAIMRAATDGEASVNVNAVAKDGNILAHWPVIFADGAPRAVVPLDLPPDLRNQVARFEIEGQRTAAAVALLDAAWKHRTVGIVGDAGELDRHSLLSEIFYIDRALKPYADLHVDTLDALLKSNVPVLIVTDATGINNESLPALTAWLKQGGVLVRFVGEHFAASDDHAEEAEILPVPLRSGGRSLDGALTWGTPQKLQNFPATSPFHNLPVPDDVTVSRQVLAEPSADLASKTWAALADGTPLVTAAAIGKGTSILFHVPARSSWSNLPISGLFVNMLQRILPLARSDHAASLALSSSFPPLLLLDATGEDHAPDSTAIPIPADAITSTAISPQHPPGLYGTDANNIALNLGAAVGQPESLHNVPLSIPAIDHQENDLQPALLLAAFLLLLLDFVMSLRMRGLLKFALLLLGLFCWAHTAHAETDAKMAVEFTSKTYLAYVRTGDAEVDHVSERGLYGLAAMLQKRTSVDQVGVTRVDPDTDDLAFFPLLYWPLIAGQQPLTPEGAKRVTYYLQHGGMIVFDAVNNEDAAPGFLQHVLAGVDLPPLVRLPEKHVLKYSFYLLNDFPGRFTGNDFWLEPEDTSTYDGVASVLYGSNSWAAAWAVDEAGHPLYPCSPDGEIQREHAYRFGINLVLYALTGNYKNDQVHASALLQRMRK